MSKILVYADSGWSLGPIYRKVAAAVGADLHDWAVPPPPGLFKCYELVVTLPGTVSEILVSRFGVPRRKIALVAHADCDILQLILSEGVGRVGEYAGYAVVSDALACTSLSLGITRVPDVLKQGIDCDFYSCDPSRELRVLGYAALPSRTNEHGVEIKRGYLAERVAEKTGLPLARASGLTRDQMPGFYRGIDCLLMTSLQEGGAMPPYEAAASGRLVVGTPVGDFPRLALEDMGVLAPLNDDAFVDLAVDVVSYYAEHPQEFSEKCELAATKTRMCRNWPVVIGDWSRFVSAAHERSLA